MSGFKFGLVIRKKVVFCVFTGVWSILGFHLQHVMKG